MPSETALPPHPHPTHTSGAERFSGGAVGPQGGALGPPASAPLEEKVAFFRRHGYVPVWGALEGEALRRTQAAYRQHSLRVKAEWEAAKLSGTGVDGLGYEEGGEGFARSYFVRAATHFAKV